MDALLRFQNALSRPTVPLLSRLGARIELDSNKQPLAVAGVDCVVFRLTQHNGDKLALRLPRVRTGADEWAVRYGGLSAFQHAGMRSRLPGKLEVIRNAIAVEAGESENGIERLPVLVSEWIDGPTLIAAADRAARAGNAQILRALANAVRDAMNDLRTSGFVHGDITANNLVIRKNGQIAFVDLDGASWPGSPLGSVGSGSPNYRHPGGTPSTLLRDGFAFLVIYASLLALAEQPQRRTAWGDPVETPDAAILLSEWDLNSPGTSECFEEIQRSSGREVARLFGALRDTIQEGPESIARHVEVIPGLVPVAPQEPGFDANSTWDLNAAVRRVQDKFTSTPAPVVRYPTSAVEPEPPVWGALESRSAASQGEDDIRELRAQLIAALDTGNEVDVARIWSNLAEDPVARTMALDVESVFARGYVHRIEQETRQGRDSVVVSIGEEAQLRQIPLSTAARARLRRARDRIDVRARLDQALTDNSREDLANLAVSGQLVVLGNTDRGSLVRVLQALEWPLLERALNSDDDRLIEQAYDPELFDGAGNLPQAVIDRVALARARLQWAERVRASLSQHLASEVVALFDEAPDQAEAHLSASERRRAHKIVEQQRAMRQLADAIQSGDESEIVTALSVVERVGARLGEHFPWHAIRDVLERVSLIEDIIEAARAKPIDHLKLAQLIPAARAAGLDTDSRLRGEFDLDTLQGRVIQAAHLRRIRAAIERNDDASIVSASLPDVYDVLDELTSGERQRVARAIRSQRRYDRDGVAVRFAADN